MYCYSNNGLSMRAVPAAYTAGTGEILFTDIATSEQLTSAFPDYSAAASEASTKAEIAVLEASITPRMIQEAAIGSALTGLGSDHTLTSAQFITQVRAEIAALRVSI